jgi:hypothetical protein
MQRQREPPQPFTHRVPETPSVVLMLETDDATRGPAQYDGPMISIRAKIDGALACSSGASDLPKSIDRPS